MAYPTILFNNSTGSDTASSGAGPGTALSGTTASYSGSVFTLDGTPDLSGVATDGSHVIWVDTSTGRKWFTINATDDGADTVTVDDAPAGTTTGLTWGLGGKRSTIDGSITLFNNTDAKPGWTIDIEETGVNYSLTGPITMSMSGDTTTGRILWTSSSATPPTIQLVGSPFWSMIDFSGNYCTISHMKFSQENDAAIIHAVFRNSADNKMLHFIFSDLECTQENSTQSDVFIRSYQNTGSAGPEVVNCYFHDCGGIYINHVQGRHGPKITGNRFTDITGVALHIEDCYEPLVERNIFDNASGRAIQLKDNSALGEIKNNVIYSCTDGIGVTATGAMFRLNIANNIIVSNSLYGIAFDAAYPRDLISEDSNAFYNNTSGETNSNITNGDNDITLTADPFTDAASGDFTLNDTAGGGAACKGVGEVSEVGLITGTRTNFVDLGAYQAEVSAGGGSSRLINGGLVS